MTLKKLILPLGLLLGPVLGFGLGRFTAPPAEPPSAPPPSSQEVAPDPRAHRAEAPVAAPAPGVMVVDRDVLRQEIQQTLREELGAFKQQLAAQAAEQETSKVERPAEPTPENLTAFDAGNRLVDAALLSHRWVEKDAEELRSSMRQMTEGQREQVLHRLLPAINRQEIRPEVKGMPF